MNTDASGDGAPNTMSDTVGTVTWIEPTEWYARMPSFYGAAAALITAPGTDRVLLVKPTYRDYWAFPGGYIECDEYPHDACGREVSEELGLDLAVGALLVVDWAPPAGPRPRAIVSLTFDAGQLPEDVDLRLADDEIEAWRFFDSEDARRVLPGNVAPRVCAALRARHTGTVAYLAAGTPPHADRPPSTVMASRSHMP